ncbi:MAG: transposase [Planctomycetota bacterium]|nr:transposase [Planctomycetota bacterium]
MSDESGRSKQRTYTDDFRWDVVRLITEERYSILAAARACGVSDQTVRNWYGRLAPAGDDATRAKAANSRYVTLTSTSIEKCLATVDEQIDAIIAATATSRR